MATNYPTSIAEIDAWAKESGKPSLEARTRFLKFVILTCVANHKIAQRNLVLKGGNALRFAYQSPRSTKDLDFSAVSDEIPDDNEMIRQMLDNALKFAEQRFGAKAKCQKVKRNPPKSPETTKPTYAVSVAYALPADRYYANFAEKNVFPTIVPVEISLNEVVCETKSWQPAGGLQVCSLEDIVAEKLRSLLQQKPRKRNRWQDAYDICANTRNAQIDKVKVSQYLIMKSEDRAVEVRKSAFDEEIREKAAYEYDRRMAEEAPDNLIDFEEAWEQVLQLVKSLDIPE